MSKDESSGANQKSNRSAVNNKNNSTSSTNSNGSPFYPSSSTNTGSVNPNSPVGGSSSFTAEEVISRKIDEYIQVSTAAAAAKINEIFTEKLVFVQQSEKKVSQRLESSEALIASINLSLENIKSQTSNSQKLQAELQEEVKYIKGNAISALSVFVSFFAFIAVTINVFSKAESVVSAAVLVLIFWCLLIGFNIMISVQFKVFSNVKIIWFALAFVIFVSIFSIVGLYYFSPELQGVRYVFKFVT
ncbi:hypothetical protein [Pseudomonas bubulae]|uniref:Transmembrane protein n=1 Tax=Pseudomonas bubulae TaxID=2316085 RepID=A0ABZ2H294_9PSED